MINTFKKLKETVSKEPEECVKSMSHQMEIISKEIGIFFFLKIQIDILKIEKYNN